MPSRNGRRRFCWMNSPTLVLVLLSGDARTFTTTASFVGPRPRFASPSKGFHFTDTSQRTASLTKTTSSTKNLPCLSASLEEDIDSGSSASSLPLSSPSSSPSQSSKFRFLGYGENAVVRPGVVLVAPKDEYNHYLMNSAIFIYAIGLDEYEELVIRGVIIDHPTAFNMGEMSSGSVTGVLAHNPLYRGGENGRETAMLLHSCQSIQNGEGGEIGTSGIYEGGLQKAMDMFDAGGDEDGTASVTPSDFKFFFNYCQFSEAEIEQMFRGSEREGLDSWASVEVEPDFVLSSDWDRGEAWRILKNYVTVQHEKQQQQEYEGMYE